MSELLLATIRSNVKESRQGKTYKFISHFEKPSKMELLLVKHLLNKIKKQLFLNGCQWRNGPFHPAGANGFILTSQTLTHLIFCRGLKTCLLKKSNDTPSYKKRLWHKRCIAKVKNIHLTLMHIHQHLKIELMCAATPLHRPCLIIAALE